VLEGTIKGKLANFFKEHRLKMLPASEKLID
jgi:hypothetical protein